MPMKMIATARFPWAKFMTAEMIASTPNDQPENFDVSGREHTDTSLLNVTPGAAPTLTIGPGQAPSKDFRDRLRVGLSPSGIIGT